jgi:hypothetical protein
VKPEEKEQTQEEAEEELEKPSFLRRLTSRRSHKGDETTEDK